MEDQQDDLSDHLEDVHDRIMLYADALIYDIIGHGSDWMQFYTINIYYLFWI